MTIKLNFTQISNIFSDTYWFAKIKLLIKCFPEYFSWLCVVQSIVQNEILHKKKLIIISWDLQSFHEIAVVTFRRQVIAQGYGMSRFIVS